MWHAKIGAIGFHPLGVANKARQYSRGQRQDLVLEASAIEDDPPSHAASIAHPLYMARSVEGSNNPVHRAREASEARFRGSGATDGWASSMQQHPEKERESGEYKSANEPNQRARLHAEDLYGLHQFGILLRE